MLAVDGSWQRSANLHETPVQFTVQWEGAQLGQVTKLTLGQDKGWRGGVRLSAELTGTPRDLHVNTEGSIDDFRRYDISGDRRLAPGGAMQRPLQFDGPRFLRAACRAPVGDGEIVLNGSVAPCLVSSYDLTMLVRKPSPPAAGGIRPAGKEECAHRHYRRRQVGRKCQRCGDSPSTTGCRSGRAAAKSWL